MMVTHCAGEFGREVPVLEQELTDLGVIESERILFGEMQGETLLVAQFDQFLVDVSIPAQKQDLAQVMEEAGDEGGCRLDISHAPGHPLAGHGAGQAVVPKIPGPQVIAPLLFQKEVRDDDGESQVADHVESEHGHGAIERRDTAGIAKPGRIGDAKNASRQALVGFDELDEFPSIRPLHIGELDDT